MPELPEVETISRSLQSNLDARITDIDIKRPDIVRQKDYEFQEVYNEMIGSIIRRGKFLAIIIGNGLNIIFHMGMSGRLYMLKENSAIMEHHVHIVIHLNNYIKLLFQDTRRFGGVWFINNLDQFFCTLGKEPLSNEFTTDYLLKITRNRKIAIKSLILNQKLICGIGNIYADEALFEAGIRPERPAKNLSINEIKSLCRAIKSVLTKSIEERGTTFRDYRDGYNQSGNFQNYLKVYGKNNQMCPRCGEAIKKIKIGGRSSHFCENCQK